MKGLQSAHIKLPYAAHHLKGGQLSKYLLPLADVRVPYFKIYVDGRCLDEILDSAIYRGKFRSPDYPIQLYVTNRGRVDIAQLTNCRLDMTCIARSLTFL
jgi:hypothetical protein